MKPQNLGALFWGSPQWKNVNMTFEQSPTTTPRCPKGLISTDAQPSLRARVSRRSLLKFALSSSVLIGLSGPALGKPPAVVVPPLQIIAPESGVSVAVGEKLEIQVLVRKDIRPSAIQISCDGKGIALLNKAPFSATWDTSGLKGGTYIIEVSAYLDSGAKLSAIPVEVTLQEQARSGTSAGAMLLEGTPILLATEEFLKSGDTKTGTAIRFRVERDVLGPDGAILIPYGASAIGEVLQSRAHGLFGKAGKLDFALRSVTAADGTEVPIRAVRNHAANGKTGTVIVGALLLTPLVLLFNGPNVEIPVGTVITAYIDRNTPISSTLPSRLDPALNIERAVAVVSPAPGQVIKKEKSIRFEVGISPPDDGAYVRLYLNGQMILNEKPIAGALEWRGSKQFDNGTYSLEAEVTYSSGHVVKAAPVEFVLGRLKR